MISCESSERFGSIDMFFGRVRHVTFRVLIASVRLLYFTIFFTAKHRLTKKVTGIAYTHWILGFGMCDDSVGFSLGQIYIIILLRLHCSLGRITIIR